MSGERAAFEAWAASEGISDGVSLVNASCWLAWQARAAIAQPAEPFRFRCGDCCEPLADLFASCPSCGAAPEDADIAQPAEPRDDHFPDAGKMVAQADAQPVAWVWKHTKNGSEGLYWQHPSTYGINTANPLYEWMPVYAAAPPARQPLTDEQALNLARKHLDKGLSWAPHITRCTDLEIRALIRAIERAHGIGREGE